MIFRYKLYASFLSFLLVLSLIFTTTIFANTPSAGGDTTVVNPSGEGAVSTNEDAPEPESSNIRLIVPTLTDTGGGTPNSIRIISITGGTMKDSGGGAITLGNGGTILSLSSSRVDLRFKPASNRNTNASFQYVVVDPHDNAVNSTASTATIPITSVNDTPLLQTVVGATGTGLAATYYISEWDLTGATYNRVDSTINFSNNFGVPGLNTNQFSVRWTGKIESPVTGNVTFSTQSDDGVRLWVNGVQIIDNWTLHGTTTDTSAPVALEAGTKYDIQMEFYERGGGEVAVLQWEYTGQSTQVIPQSRLFPGTVRPALNFINGSSAVVIDDGITVNDVDSTTMTGGTIEISNNYQSGEDSLQFTNQNGITGSYSTGTLTLSGTATLAQYQAALRSVKYFNSAGSPNTSTRTIRFRVNDGADNSNYVFRDIAFSATNTPPVITEGANTSVTMDEDGTPTPFSLTLNGTDADEHSITWSISTPASHGTASAGDPGNSVAISYTPTANYSGTDSFVVQASDGAGGTDTITVNVTITSDGTDESVSSSPTSSNNSSSSSSPSSSNSSPCSGQIPVSNPDLFQISSSPTSATLYFTPVNPITGYVISYGTTSEANEFSASFTYTNGNGPASLTVNSLLQNTTYYFKVRGINGCVPGGWSNIVKTITTGTTPNYQSPKVSPTPTPIPQGTIKILEKEQIYKPKEATSSGDGYDLTIKVMENNKPVEGATVEVHSTPRKTVTDKDGLARFTGVEGGSHKVILAYEGYNGEEKIKLEGDKKDVTINFTVELKPSSTFFSKSAITIIVILLIIITLLLFFIWKRRKRKEKTSKDTLAAQNSSLKHA